MSVSIYIAGASSEDDFNVSNGNFVRLMDLIGVDADTDDGLCGSFDGDALRDLESKIVFTLASLAAMPEMDGGVAAVRTRGDRGAVAIDCGIPEGYYERRLTALLTLVRVALATGQRVIYS